jgi:hypothetical protein
VVAIPAAPGAYLFPDTSKGIERLYVVFSNMRWEALEDALVRQSEQAPRTNLVPLTTPLGNVGRRASTTYAPAQISRTHHSLDFQLFLTSPPIETTNSHLVIERWFRHD